MLQMADDPKVKDGGQFKVRLTPDLQKRLSVVLGRYGLKNVEACRRLFEALADADDALQAWLLKMPVQSEDVMAGLAKSLSRTKSAAAARLINDAAGRADSPTLPPLPVIPAKNPAKKR